MIPRSVRLAWRIGLLMSAHVAWAADYYVTKAGNDVECPRISSTDVDDLRLLAEWHEVRQHS